MCSCGGRHGIHNHGTNDGLCCVCFIIFIELFLRGVCVCVFYFYINQTILFLFVQEMGLTDEDLAFIGVKNAAQRKALKVAAKGFVELMLQVDISGFFNFHSELVRARFEGGRGGGEGATQFLRASKAVDR